MALAFGVRRPSCQRAACSGTPCRCRATAKKSSSMPWSAVSRQKACKRLLAASFFPSRRSWKCGGADGSNGHVTCSPWASRRS